MHPEQQNNGMNAFHFFIFIFKLIMTSMPLLSNVNGNFSDNLKKYRLLFVASTRIQCVPVVQHSNEIAKKKEKKWLAKYDMPIPSVKDSFRCCGTHFVAQNEVVYLLNTYSTQMICVLNVHLFMYGKVCSIYISAAGNCR